MSAHAIFAVVGSDGQILHYLCPVGHVANNSNVVYDRQAEMDSSTRDLLYAPPSQRGNYQEMIQENNYQSERVIQRPMGSRTNNAIPKRDVLLGARIEREWSVNVRDNQEDEMQRPISDGERTAFAESPFNPFGCLRPIRPF